MQSRSIPCWTGQNTELGNVPGSMPMYCSVPYMCYRYACHRCLSVVRSLALSENAPHRLRAIQAWRMNRSYIYVLALHHTPLPHDDAMAAYRRTHALGQLPAKPTRSTNVS